MKTPNPTHTTAPQPTTQPATAPAWTPGPWAAVANRPEDDPKLDRVKSQDGSNVAFIPDHEHNHAEENANARLIAAAPELAEALRDVVRSLDSLCFSVFEIRAGRKTLIDPREAPTIQQARAILARLQGNGEQS